MPKKLERKLWKEAREKHPNDIEAQKAYVFGTMNKLGLLHKKEKEK